MLLPVFKPLLSTRNSLHLFKTLLKAIILVSKYKWDCLTPILTNTDITITINNTMLKLHWRIVLSLSQVPRSMLLADAWVPMLLQQTYNDVRIYSGNIAEILVLIYGFIWLMSVVSGLHTGQELSSAHCKTKSTWMLCLIDLTWNRIYGLFIN